VVGISAGAALILQNGITLPSGNVLTINGTGLSGGGALESYSGSNTYQGAVTLGSAASIRADAGSTLTLTGGIDVSTPSHNALTALGNLVQNGALKNGNVTTAAAYQTGYTVLTGNGTGGTLTVGNATVSGNLTLGNGAHSTLDGITLTLGNLTVSGSGTLVQSGPLSSTNAANVLTINSTDTVQAYYGSGSTTFTGTMAGAGTFQKDGAGTLVFATTFSAPSLTLNVSGGTLALYNAAAAVNLTLGTIHFVNSSTINGGTTAITLDFGSVGSYATSLSSTNLIIDQGVSVNVINWASESDFWYATGAFGSSFYQYGTNLQAVPNTQGVNPQNQIVFANWQGADTAWIQAPYSYWTDREIRPIPEPATYGGLLLSGCLALFGWRRYRHRASAPQA
jgi:hypothetical protein